MPKVQIQIDAMKSHFTFLTNLNFLPVWYDDSLLAASLTYFDVSPLYNTPVSLEKYAQLERVSQSFIIFMQRQRLAAECEFHLQ